MDSHGFLVYHLIGREHWQALLGILMQARDSDQTSVSEEAIQKQRPLYYLCFAAAGLFFFLMFAVVWVFTFYPDNEPLQGWAFKVWFASIVPVLITGYFGRRIKFKYDPKEFEVVFPYRMKVSRWIYALYLFLATVFLLPVSVWLLNAPDPRWIWTDGTVLWVPLLLCFVGLFVSLYRSTLILYPDRMSFNKSWKQREIRYVDIVRAEIVRCSRSGSGYTVIMRLEGKGSCSVREDINLFLYDYRNWTILLRQIAAASPESIKGEFAHDALNGIYPVA